MGVVGNNTCPKNKIMKKLLVSIIIPTLNERDNITNLIGILTNLCTEKNYLYEIIVIDDNSVDGTVGVVQDIARRDRHIRLLAHRVKLGLGRSIREGIKNARGEVVVGMDADLNHDPMILPYMIEALSSADLVVASRFVSGGGMAEVGRYWASLLFNSLLHLCLTFPIWDNTSGYYAVKSTTLRRLCIDDIYVGYGEYHLRLVYEAMRKGMRIVEVPVFYKKRQFGKSKSRLATMARVYMGEAIRLRMSKDNYEKNN